MGLLDQVIQGVQRNEQVENAQFDMNDPADKQSMMDAAGYAHILRGVPEGDRGQVWPKMANQLMQSNPKFKNLLDPNSPPNDKVLAQLTGRKAIVPGSAIDETPNSETEAFLKGEEGSQQENDGSYDLSNMYAARGSRRRVRRIDLKSKDDKKGPGDLAPATKNLVQKKLITNVEDYDTLSKLYDSWDSKAFTLQGQATEKFSEIKDYLGMSSKKDQDLLHSRTLQKQRVDRMMLTWRKYITGVAGGEKEMARIEQTTLNTNQTPTQALASRDELMRRTLRDRIVYTRLLKKGFLVGGNVDEKAYSKAFMDEREQVTTEFNDYIKRFKEVNPDASDVDALMYKEHKARQKQRDAQLKKHQEQQGQQQQQQPAMRA